MNQNNQIKCPFTGVLRNVFATRVAGGYRLVKLSEIGAWTTRDLPSPEELMSSYQSFDAGELSKQNFDEYKRLAGPILQREMAWHQMFPTDVESMRFLDYGCGGAHFVAAANDLGMCSMGIEVDKESVEHARSFGLNVVSGQLPDNKNIFGSQKFDVIKMSHVLEHVLSPFDLIQACYELLNAGGLLIINVPNQAALPSRIKIGMSKLGLRPKDYGYVQPPIHLHGLTPETLKAVGRHWNMDLLQVDEHSPMDKSHFPTSAGYWSNLPFQRMVYSASRLSNSPGYMTGIFRKVL